MVKIIFELPVLLTYFSTTRVDTAECGRSGDMGRSERRERKGTARTCHNIDAFLIQEENNLYVF